jgi:hypothetical protein
MSVPKQGSNTKRLQLDRFLYQQSVFAFVAFFGLALWAFWTSYYGKLHEDIIWPMRLHGVAMTAWCLMLIGQALLIRLKKNRLHKLTGKLSYLIVAVILISGAHLAHITVKEIEQGSSFYYYFIALMFNSLIVFGILFGLAMWYRKQPLKHARFMVCTIFPILTPITDRLIYKYFDSLIPLAPTLDGMPMVQTLGFALGDILLMGLLIWDWRAHKRLDVFPVAFAMLALYHISVVTFHQFQLWQHMGDWIMSLPLS